MSAYFQLLSRHVVFLILPIVLHSVFLFSFLFPFTEGPKDLIGEIVMLRAENNNICVPWELIVQ